LGFGPLFEKVSENAVEPISRFLKLTSTKLDNVTADNMAQNASV
jgi:hypothetical protein